VRRVLATLDDVGLGYVQLGQPAPTLSSGEAQRVKLAAELARPSTGKTLYILDEPTTGLHFDDIRKLLRVIHRLVDLGNTVVCIEHNLDVIKTADWVIDLGPEAGDAGGRVVIADTPENVAACGESHTGRALKPVLDAGPHEDRKVKKSKNQKVKTADPDSELRTQNLVLGVGDASLPWERDGRAWHLRERTSHDGRPIEWKADVLEWLVDTIEAVEGFAPTDWNERARVEIKAPGSRNTWFFHARTQGRWLLDVTLRVPRGTFDRNQLARELDVKTLDERKDLPIYGQQERVDLRPAHQGCEDVRLHLHDMKDVNKVAMAHVLKKAAGAYLDMVRQADADPQQAEPWKADGQSWHLSQRSISDRGRIRWKPALLMELIGRLRKLAPQVELDWSTKTAIMVRYPGVQVRLGKIVTCYPQGLRIEIQTPAGAVTPTQIERLGQHREIRNHRGLDWVNFWIRGTSDVHPEEFALVVRAGLGLVGRKWVPEE